MTEGGDPEAPAAPHPPQDNRPRLSVVIPAFGEERRIGATVQRVRGALGDLGVEIVVVDDGSADDTEGAARAAGADQVVRLPVNRGKGAAVRAGVMASRGSAVVFTDADLAYAPQHVVEFVQQIETGWDVVVGSRLQPRSYGARDIGHAVFRGVTRLVLTRRFTDTQCGIKGFHRDAADAIFARTTVDGFAFDVEVLWLAGHLGLSVTEQPVVLDAASASAQRSTVRLSSDSLRMLRDLLRIRRRAMRGAYGAAGPH